MTIRRTPSIITMNKLFLILLCLSILVPLQINENQLSELSSNVFSEVNVNSKMESTTGRVVIEDTILPKTNLTVSQYISGQGQVNTYSTSVLSLNNTHWFTRSYYANTSAITSPFDSLIQRDSVNHSYSTSNYWNWDELPDGPFDFWIDPTGFSIDYIYSVYIQGYGYRDATIVGLENITMTGVGTFEAWNITIDFPGFPNFAFYEKNTGFALCTYLEFIGDIWYNLTLAEIAVLSGGYDGPVLDNFSPVNSSILASGSVVSVSMASPYGVFQIQYSWDGGTVTALSATDFQTFLPELDGLHNLSVIVTDNIGYSISFLLEYTTDNTLPGIILNDPQNNSRIQGTRELNFSIVSGNGTFTYNWDYGPVNVSFLMSGENAVLSIPSPEVESERSLRIYIKSNVTDIWITSIYKFIIDNTPPDITIYSFENNSVIKGDFWVIFSPTENVNASYFLNGVFVDSSIVEENTNSSLIFNDLDNGTYGVELILEDEAGNTYSITLKFSIYTSAFNWNWHLNANQAHSYDFIDDTGAQWFSFVIVSASEQSFNISLLPNPGSPSLTTQMEFGIDLLCEVPEDIVYVTFTYLLSEPLLDENQSFPVFHWNVWDDQNLKWSESDTIYNQVLHAWVTTSIGYHQYFALVDADKSTHLKSVVVGGGQLPSFDVILVLLSISIVYVYNRKRKQKNK